MNENKDVINHSWFFWGNLMETQNMHFFSLNNYNQISKTTNKYPKIFAISTIYSSLLWKQTVKYHLSKKITFQNKIYRLLLLVSEEFLRTTKTRICWYFLANFKRTFEYKFSDIPRSAFNVMFQIWKYFQERKKIYVQII